MARWRKSQNCQADEDNGEVELGRGIVAVAKSTARGDARRVLRYRTSEEWAPLDDGVGQASDRRGAQRGERRWRCGGREKGRKRR